MLKSFILLLMLFTINSYADTTSTAKDSYRHGLGLAFGGITGYGLSYRHSLPDARLSYVVTCFPYYTRTKKTAEESAYISLGVTVLRKITNISKRLDLMAYGGVNGEYNYEKTFSWNNVELKYNDKADSVFQEKIMAVGAGLGVEYHQNKFRYSFMIGYRGSYDIALEAIEIGPSFEIMGYYCF